VQGGRGVASNCDVVTNEEWGASECLHGCCMIGWQRRPTAIIKAWRRVDNEEKILIGVSMGTWGEYTRLVMGGEEGWTWGPREGVGQNWDKLYIWEVEMWGPHLRSEMVKIVRCAICRTHYQEILTCLWVQNQVVTLVTSRLSVRSVVMRLCRIWDIPLPQEGFLIKEGLWEMPHASNTNRLLTCVTCRLSVCSVCL
jgi:hypothetical protein